MNYCWSLSSNACDFVLVAYMLIFLIVSSFWTINHEKTIVKLKITRWSNEIIIITLIAKPSPNHKLQDYYTVHFLRFFGRNAEASDVHFGAKIALVSTSRKHDHWRQTEANLTLCPMELFRDEQAARPIFEEEGYVQNARRTAEMFQLLRNREWSGKTCCSRLALATQEGIYQSGHGDYR